MLSAAALLLLAGAAPATSPAGLYETHQMEVAAGLELKADGRFRYALTYGAMDEQAEGNWSFKGKTVRLTSKPAAKAAGFEEFAPAAFRNEPLERHGEDLLLRRYDTTFRFVRVRH
jgi:hypothetical protein